MTVALLSDPACGRYSTGLGHPEREARHAAVSDALASLPGCMQVAAPPVERAHLVRAHDAAYVDGLFAHDPVTSRIALDAGVHYAYTGNVHDEGGGSTYCSNCGERLIGRDWYQLTEWTLTDDGHCQHCGSACHGHFDGPPGTWGARRLPVRMADYAESP